MIFFAVILGVVSGYTYEKMRGEIWRMAPKGLFVFRVISFFVCLAAVITGAILLAFYVEGFGLRYGSAMKEAVVFVLAVAMAASVMRVVGYDKRMRA